MKHFVPPVGIPPPPRPFNWLLLAALLIDAAVWAMAAALIVVALRAP